MHPERKAHRQRRTLKRRLSALGGLCVSAAFLFFPRVSYATDWEEHTAIQATAGGGTSTPVQVKASHITQMRSVIDALRGTAACGSLAPLNWRTVGTGVTVIADDINSIKTEISDPRYNVPVALINAIPTITSGSTNPTPVRASHVVALRAAIDQANCSGPTGCNIYPGTMSLCNVSECCLPDTVNGPPYEVCTIIACVPANQATTCTGLPSINNCGVPDPTCPGTMVCITEGELSLTSTHFSSHGVYGNWRNINTNQNYYLEVPDGSGGTSQVVPFGDYEWLGGDVVTESGCPVPGDPPDISPPIGTTKTLDAVSPGFDASVGCH